MASRALVRSVRLLQHSGIIKSASRRSLTVVQTAKWTQHLRGTWSLSQESLGTRFGDTPDRVANTSQGHGKFRDPNQPTAHFIGLDTRSNKSAYEVIQSDTSVSGMMFAMLYVTS
ncbi:NADH:ubiquinone oxidoreductase subunit AB1b isoform X2 [Tachysurus fulvidraco]|uniref:NADH:ubiquinone oxidoreductase subunit AB1b isoform X2 n=1 Tax=Tachysurus fulvidraco TaxID=1234273 RepID=UPI000F4E1BA1|nr:NADH:ubiquinone oxidoreductase subunit AB1b isoform X2 [Tachysurus fulvidraco]